MIFFGKLATPKYYTLLSDLSPVLNYGLASSDPMV